MLNRGDGVVELSFVKVEVQYLYVGTANWVVVCGVPSVKNIYV